MLKQIRLRRFREYRESLQIASEKHSFNALIMAAMRKPGYKNLAKLKHAWAKLWQELMVREPASGGALNQNERDWLKEQRGGD